MNAASTPVGAILEDHDIVLIGEQLDADIEGTLSQVAALDASHLGRSLFANFSHRHRTFLSSDDIRAARGRLLIRGCNGVTSDVADALRLGLHQGPVALSLSVSHRDVDDDHDEPVEIVR